MDRDGFKEALLAIMERKVHWAWPHFTSGRVPARRLHIHFEQEYATYVRDFPVMVGWAYVQCPIAEVRRDLAENLTRKRPAALIAGRPHPELFLEYPRGLGMDLVALRARRAAAGGAAVSATSSTSTRSATAGRTPPRSRRSSSRAPTTSAASSTRTRRSALRRRSSTIRSSCTTACRSRRLALTKAHRRVEGSHRAAAWRMILDHVPELEYGGVLAAMERTLEAWLAYRDEVAAACGLDALIV